MIKKDGSATVLFIYIDMYGQIFLINMNLTYAYIFLVLAIAFEVLSTSFLKDTNGFTNFYPSLVVVSALCVCLYLMSHSMKFIPVGIVYASWAGLGIVAITIIAVIKYKQIPNIPTIIGIALIVIGVVAVSYTHLTLPTKA